MRGDDLPPGLDLIAFDAAVNSGPSRGAKWLRPALGVVADGKVEPAAVAADEGHPNPTNIIRGALDRRPAF